MEYFCFTSTLSAEFFQWLLDLDAGHGENNARGLVDRLIDAAVRMAAEDGEALMAEDTSYMTREKLTSILEDLAAKEAISEQDWYGRFAYRDLSELDLIDAAILTDDSMDFSTQMLRYSLLQIDYRDVAEAMLRLRNKWAPD